MKIANCSGRPIQDGFCERAELESPSREVGPELLLDLNAAAGLRSLRLGELVVVLSGKQAAFDDGKKFLAR